MAEFGASGDRETVDVDLSDFIPSGVDPQTVAAALLDLPTSAILECGALVRVCSFSFESPLAMPLFGHLDDDTVVLYGPEALMSNYNGGDLAHITSTPQEQTAFTGVSEAYGNLGIPQGS